MGSHHREIMHQDSVALSTSEEDCMAVNEVGKEVVYISDMLEAIGAPQLGGKEL